MKTAMKTNKIESILGFVSSNPNCDNSQITLGTSLGKETVRLTLIKLAKEKKITVVITGKNNKKTFSTKSIVQKVKKIEINKKIETSIVTVLPTGKKQNIKPAVVKHKKFGIGLIYNDEPIVTLKQQMFVKTKIIMHLVNAKMEPIMINGNPKKILTTMENLEIITPFEKIQKIAIKREKVKREKGTSSSIKDFSKYKFNGQLYSKGRLVHAIITKFANDNNPTLIELQTAFPDAVIRPYGKLFISSSEAIINEEQKRSRFFTKNEELINIKNAKIAISNQIDGGLVNRILTLMPSIGFEITKENILN